LASNEIENQTVVYMHGYNSHNED